ncbi:MAG: hypothetical protein AAF636_18770, partial [Pseudomonadota bacterium]
HAKALEARQRKKGLALEFQRTQMVERHRKRRSVLKKRHAERRQFEQRERAGRLPRGFKGLWSWITGALNKARLRNEIEASKAEDRDRTERHALIQQQLIERRGLQEQIKALQASHEHEMEALHRDIACYLEFGMQPPAHPERKRAKHKDVERNQDHDIEPS